MVNRLLAKNLFQKKFPFQYVYYTNIDDTTGAHNHDYYELFLVTKGTVTHVVNNKNQILPENSLVFVRPEDTHFYKKINQEKCYFFNLAFPRYIFEEIINYFESGKTIEHLLRSTNISPYVVIPLKDKYLIQSRLEKINTISYEETQFKKMQYKTLLIELFLEYVAGDCEINKSIPAWLYNLYQKMQKKENFIKGRKVLMKSSSRSEEHICRMFKKYFQQTPTAYINNLRLNYAANLLANSDQSIINIALTTGFNNLSHFYHLFKEKYQQSPGQFRKNNQENTLS